jgi:hypothetical protein
MHAEPPADTPNTPDSHPTCCWLWCTLLLSLLCLLRGRSS